MSASINPKEIPSIQQGQSPIYTTCNQLTFFADAIPTSKQVKQHKPVHGSTYNRNSKRKSKKPSEKYSNQLIMRYAKENKRKKAVGLPVAKIDHFKEADKLRKEISKYSDRVNTCQTPLMSKVGVTRNGFTNLSTCKSKACPHCTMRKEEKEMKKIKEIIEQSLLSGYKILFITFTGKHDRFESYEELRDELIKAYERMQNSSKCEKLKKEYGLFGYVKKVEETFQITNGWHNHLHVLFILDTKKDTDNFVDKMFEMWSNQYSKNYGKTLDRKAFVSKEVTTQEGISRYMAKSWGISDEMTISSRKKGKGVHPMYLIRKYKETGNTRYLSAFKEYESAMYKKSITYSQGLSKAFSYEVMLKYAEIKNMCLDVRKEELSEEGKMLFDPNKILFNLCKSLYSNIRNKSMRGNILDIINSTYHSASDFWIMIENVELYIAEEIQQDVFFAGNCFYLLEEKNIPILEEHITKPSLNTFFA